MNARELARLIQGQFQDAGIPDAAFEAEYLVRATAGVDRATYLTGPALATAAVAHVESAVGRRLRREPAAYILGTREFYGLPFAVTDAVLVPRPESELLVEVALKELRDDRAARVVDVGTGSGCIAVSVAANAPSARVIAVDCSVDALAVAVRNARAHGVPIAFIQGDLLAPLAAADMVLANLPYIPSAEIAGLDPEVRDWEPRLALDGGADGLDAIRRLIAGCADRIRPRLLALEVGAVQAPMVACLCARTGASVEIADDLAGNERVVMARWR